jgi:Mrp family chromosome partitioning ATPase
MERIQAAIQKAKEQRSGAEPVATPRRGAPLGSAPEAPRAAGGWEDLPAFSPDPDRMRRERIVSFERSDPAHMTFDMMRTKILRMMVEKGWSSLAITSPTAECGKTMSSLNLAFSFAQQKDSRTVLMDLDLRRPSVAETLGLTGRSDIEEFLRSGGETPANFVRYGDGLAIGASLRPARNPAELLNHASCGAALARMKADLNPDTVIYDLPPMLTCDDVMAFLPNVDCVLLIAGAEISTIDEIDRCENDLAQQTNVLGVVLNKCRYAGEEYGYGYY